MYIENIQNAYRQSFVYRKKSLEETLSAVFGRPHCKAKNPEPKKEAVEHGTSPGILLKLQEMAKEIEECTKNGHEDNR